MDQKTDRLIKFLFTKDKTKLYIFIIFSIALLIRVIAAINLGVAADDMHFTMHAIGFLNSDKLVTYDQSAGLWYILTNLFYNLFGTNQLSSRLVPVIFGSLSVIGIFLLTKEFFGTRAALFAGALLAVSSFHIRNTLAEMDVLAIFFVIFASFYFIKATKKNEISHYTISGIFLGLGIYTKVYVLLFIPVLITYFFYSKKDKKEILKISIRNPLIVFLLIVFIFCIPAITHNYLLYKDKGIMDFLFTNTIGIGREKGAEYYSWDPGWGAKANIKGFFLGNSPYSSSKLPTSLVGLGYLFSTDIIIFIMGSIGLICLLYNKNRKFLYFAISILIFVFFYMASRILLSKHYLFLLIIFVPSAGYCISLLEKFLNKKKNNLKLEYILIIIVLLGLITLGIKAEGTMNYVYGKSSVAQIMEFKDKNVGKEDIIVADSRIYRGQIHWSFNGKNYIEAMYFVDLINLSNTLGNNYRPTNFYFVECVSDDCGWGTIGNQPEFNDSMEKLIDTFIELNSTIVSEIYGPEAKLFYYPYSEGKNLEFRVYKTTLAFNPLALEALKPTKVWFHYPIGYDRSIQPIFDDYEPKGLIDKSLNSIAHLIKNICLLLAIISMIYPFYILINEKNEVINNNSSL